MYKNILVHQKENGLTTISLNRPEAYNSLHEEMCIELTTAFTTCGGDSTRVIVLTGIGKGFSSGQDIRALLGNTELKPSEVVRKAYNPLILSMRNLAKPIVCRLNGVAAGAGCSLALACDIIVASEEAYLSEAFVGIGLVPDSGSSFFLPRLVGRLKSFEMLSLGTKIPAAEAEKLGLVNRVVPSQELDKAVEAIVLQYLQSPLQAVGIIKKMLNESYHQTLEQSLEAEGKYQDLAAATKDFKEGIAAFTEKRKPLFQGK